MTSYHSLTDEEFQSFCNEIVAFLNDKRLPEPDWQEVSYLFTFNNYEEIIQGLICFIIDINLLSEGEFNDDFLKEYLDDGEEINDERRINFACERIRNCFDGYGNDVFSLHSVEIRNSENQSAVLGFSVSGPGGQHGFEIECIGVFTNIDEILENYDDSYLIGDKELSDEEILHRWGKDDRS